MRRIKKGDDVMVITGKAKGKRGNVVRFVGDERVVVENLNMVKHHVKGNPQRGEAGGILDREMPLHYSNVALFNPQTGKPDRVGFKVLGDGRKLRFFKSTGEVVDI